MLWEAETHPFLVQTLLSVLIGDPVLKTGSESRLVAFINSGRLDGEYDVGGLEKAQKYLKTKYGISNEEINCINKELDMLKTGIAVEFYIKELIKTYIPKFKADMADIVAVPCSETFRISLLPETGIPHKPRQTAFLRIRLPSPAPGKESRT